MRSLFWWKTAPDDPKRLADIAAERPQVDIEAAIQAYVEHFADQPPKNTWSSLRGWVQRERVEDKAGSWVWKQLERYREEHPDRAGHLLENARSLVLGELRRGDPRPDSEIVQTQAFKRALEAKVGELLDRVGAAKTDRRKG